MKVQSCAILSTANALGDYGHPQGAARTANTMTMLRAQLVANMWGLQRQHFYLFASGQII